MEAQPDEEIVGMAVDENADVDELFRSPQDFVRVATQVLQNTTADKLAEASRLINQQDVRRIGQQLQNEMTPQQLQGLQQMMAGSMPAPPELSRTVKGEARKAVVIKATRTTKEIQLHDGNIRAEIASHLGGDSVEYGCSRLALPPSPLHGKTVKVYFNQNAPSQKNRRATRLAGFPVKGAAVFRCEGADLTEAALVTVEALLTGKSG